MSWLRPPQSAFEAREHAQWIAFAPAVFQAAHVLVSSGLLARFEAAGEQGATLEEIQAGSGWSSYAVRVLAESALGAGILTLENGRYRCTKTAWFLLHDPLTRVNVEFMHEISYRGLFELEDSLRTGAPKGLGTLGPWRTLYEGLASLPPATRDAWLEFDQYYSDLAFPAAWKLLAARGVRRLIDVGGNTGKFAAQGVTSDPSVQVTIVDLPGQLSLARQALAALPLTWRDRIAFHAADMLSPDAQLPGGHDAIWMSQFLACFDEAQISAILRKAAAALAPGGRLFILEPFWDRQKQALAAFCLQQTSLYFTAIANGRSRMYTSDVLIGLVRQSGLAVRETLDGVGLAHTLLVCTPEAP